MKSTIQQAEAALLEPTNLSLDQLTDCLYQINNSQIDYADIYLQNNYEENWVLEESAIKQCDYHADRGFGLRVLSGESMGFACANQIDHHTLLQAAHSARCIVTNNQYHSVNLTHKSDHVMRYTTKNPLHSLPDTAKIELLRHIDDYAKTLDPRIEKVTISLTGEYSEILIANHLGELNADLRPLVNLRIHIVAKQGKRRERGSAIIGGRYTYQLFTHDVVEHYTKKAVRQALTNLDARTTPAGVLPVVLGPGWPAVLLHEAVGHGLEGDHIRKNNSVFCNRQGTTVASPLCTIVDDGTPNDHRGSLSIDDEGTPTQNTVLIENGTLHNFMQDKHNALLMNSQSTGNGRREHYAKAPIVRMTNTYMLPGDSEPEEIIASVDKGIYAVDFSGGQVDITSGKFVFSMSEAYLIENGKITCPLKDATLIGSGAEVLTKISMVGNNLALDSGMGSCGKDGQYVPVGVGQPTVKVDEMTIGGTG